MSIEDFLLETAKIKARGVSDEYGEADFVAGPDVKCRFDPSKKSLGIDDDGKNIVIDGFFYFLPTDAPTQSERIEFEGDDYRVVGDVTTWKDGEAAEHHVKVGARKELA